MTNLPMNISLLQAAGAHLLLWACLWLVEVGVNDIHGVLIKKPQT